MDHAAAAIRYRERARTARELAAFLEEIAAPAEDVRHAYGIARLADAVADHAENEAVAELLDQLDEAPA